MKFLNWAEKEIEIACKREAPDRKDGEWDYGCACYESALKAFKSLLEDEHSGSSIGFTMNILNRLVSGKPLTLIEDTDDIWGDSDTYTDKVIYQCLRMSSLFKYVYNDGRVTYHDVNRVTCYDIDSPTVPFSYGVVSRIIDEMFPITLPYSGDDTWTVYVNQFKRCLDDRNKNDWDTEAILYAVNKQGDRVDLNIYKMIPDDCLFSNDDSMVEISKEKFMELKGGDIYEELETSK